MSEAPVPGLDRRESHRARYFGVVEFEWAGKKERGRAGDLSLGGMLIETSNPPRPGAEFSARLTLGQEEPLDTVCVVRRVIPGVGVGVEFTDLRPADLIRLRKIIDALPH
ncbi:MAG: PilZ domain-containing protein [Acidobacteria bacterium]|nr:PilZ domain-containing protein [Acidobacteriota bacterium]